MIPTLLLGTGLTVLGILGTACLIAATLDRGDD